MRRAMESLERRQPPLSDECLAVVNRVHVGLLAEIGETASEEDLLASVQELLTTEYVTTSSNNNEEAPQSKKIRWEQLAEPPAAAAVKKQPLLPTLLRQQPPQCTWTVLVCPSWMLRMRLSCHACPRRPLSCCARKWWRNKTMAATC